MHWEKLLGDLPGVYEPLIREFYANAILRNDYIDCWVRGNEFTLEVGDIDGVLGHGDLDHEDFTPFKDRMLSIETIQSRIRCFLGKGNASTQPLSFQI